MNVNTEKKNSKMTITLDGRLDTMTSPELEEVIKSSLDDVTDLRFDLKKLDYISSAGLRVLLSAQKLMNSKGRMVVSGCNENVSEIFEITGFSDILTIE